MPLSIAAYPNPFNSRLQIEVSADQAGLVAIYDVQGRLVNELGYPAGSGDIVWDGLDRDGHSVSSGAYFLEAKGGNVKKRIKVVYLK